MNGPEFIVELIKAYAEVITAIGWPLVTIVIFATIVYYLDRTMNLFGRRKKQPLSWNRFEFLLNQLEYRNQAIPVQNNWEEHRRALVCREIDNARKALEKRDHDKIQESLYIIGSLALESDNNLNKWKSIEGNITIDDAELILPDPEKSTENK